MINELAAVSVSNRMSYDSEGGMNSKYEGETKWLNDDKRQERMIEVIDETIRLLLELLSIRISIYRIRVSILIIEVPDGNEDGQTSRIDRRYS